MCKLGVSITLEQHYDNCTVGNFKICTNHQTPGGWGHNGMGKARSMTGQINGCKISVIKPVEKTKILVSRRCRCEDNVKIDHRNIYSYI
jgi:hypothetical protein